MAVDWDQIFGDPKLGSPQEAPEAAAVAAPTSPRYAPAPKTQTEAAARLAEVADAEEDIRAWAESKRLKKGGEKSASAPGGGPGDAAPKPERKAGRGVNWDEIFGPEQAPAPPPPAAPGLLERAGTWLREKATLPMPDASHVTAEQAQGMLPDESAGTASPADQSEPEQQTITRARDPRSFGTQPDRRARDAFAASDPRRVDRPLTAAEMLQQPDPDIGRRVLAERLQESQSPERQARERAEAIAAERRPQEAKPLEWTNRQMEDLRAGVKNPAARGVVSGVAELGKVGTGAVRLAADLFGADAVAQFAAGAEKKAEATSNGAMQDLKGNDKLVAEVFSSITNSLPSLALGVAGGGALRTLFAQSALQEYGAGRDAGFGIGESATRAGIMGLAEAAGEKFGFGEQIKLLKSVTKGLPSGEMAKVFGEMLVKEVPGEQLTTLMQTLADKLGPAALKPDATMADYLEAAGQTLKVTLGQSLVMGGGPAALNGARHAAARADQVSGMSTPQIIGQIEGGLRARELASFMEPGSNTAPTEARAGALKRFDELAAAFGINPKAVARAKEAVNGMPAGDVPGFLAKLADSLSQKGLVAKPIDAEGMRGLQAAVAPEAEAGADQAVEEPATPAAAPAAPAAQDFTGLDETIDRAAHEAATSPLNDRAEPTDAQKEAGNYAKGHVRISGMDVSIENPKGSVRRSKADEAQPWEVRMPAHYGYIRGSTGSDGDHVDLFIGDKGDNGSFWVINQNKPDWSFDEHKVVTGVDTAAEAIEVYRRSFADGYGDKLIGSVSQRMDAAQIKAMLPEMGKAAPVHTPKATDDLQQPDVAVPAAVPAGTPAVGRDQPGGSSRTVGPGAAEHVAVDPAAAAPAAGPAPHATAADVGARDEALTRPLGKVGRTPSAAEPVELRTNTDGTLTPYLGKTPMLDFDSGEPIVIPAGATDAQAVEAIRQAGAVSSRSKFFGVQESTSAPAPGESVVQGQIGVGEAGPGADTKKPVGVQAVERRVTSLKALLQCLMA
jgi:hypothetical protein